jgi:hypothetical protein
MSNIASPPARQPSPHWIIIEVPMLGLKATVHFRLAAPSPAKATARMRKPNGQFAAETCDLFAHAAE